MGDISNNITYYDQQAQAFYERTIGADLSSDYNALLALLPENAHILDAGCGVGRDTKYFLAQSYHVTAFDGSAEMVRLAREETGHAVYQMTFQDMTFEEEFDGVWAQLSLIHVPYEQTQQVYQKIHRALKPGGLFYATYKYGTRQMSSRERDFWNMDETSVLPYFKGLFEVIKIWSEIDTRSKVSPSQDAKLLHFIVRKIK